MRFLYLYLFGQIAQQSFFFLFGECLNVLLEVDAFLEVAVPSHLVFLQPGRGHFDFLLELFVASSLGLRRGDVKVVTEQYEELGLLFLGILGFRLDFLRGFLEGGVDGPAL